MTVQEEIQDLERRLRAYEERIAQLETDSKGRLDAGHAAELDTLRAWQHLGERHLQELRVKEASAWADDNFRSGLLSVFDRIGERLSRLTGQKQAH